MANRRKYWIPELLSPAGNLEKLKVAISYGADAVYLGGLKFGLRAASENFSREELLEGVKFAHSHQALVFVVINAFPFDSDLKELPSFVKYLESINVDALIVSDLGSLKVIKQYCQIPIHVSTQASVLNTSSAKFWKSLGASRVILGRENSVAEGRIIKEQADLEVEQFVHGSMCMAYSGNCTISNFTQGRDSNRGGCAHSCRFKYELTNQEGDSVEDFFMSSKDLEGIDFLEEFIESKIDSLKIEGRMKGPIYAATTTKVYRKLLDFYSENGFIDPQLKKEMKEEIRKVTHRKYSSGNLGDNAGSSSVFDEREHSKSAYHVLGSVVDVDDHFAFIHTKSKILPGTEIEILPFNKTIKVVKLEKLISINNEILSKTTPDQVIKVPLTPGIEVSNIVRFQK